MSKSIGIKLADGTFYPILEEGVPETKRMELTTVKDNQETVQVDLYRSETNSMEDAEYVDSLQIDNLIAHPNGEPSFAFEVSLDENNNLSAQIVDPESGEKSDVALPLVTLDSTKLEEPANFELTSSKSEPNEENVDVTESSENDLELPEEPIDSSEIFEEPQDIEDPTISETINDDFDFSPDPIDLSEIPEESQDIIETPEVKDDDSINDYLENDPLTTSTESELTNSQEDYLNESEDDKILDAEKTEPKGLLAVADAINSENAESALETSDATEEPSSDFTEPDVTDFSNAMENSANVDLDDFSQDDANFDEGTDLTPDDFNIDDNDFNLDDTTDENFDLPSETVNFDEPDKTLTESSELETSTNVTESELPEIDFNETVPLESDTTSTDDSSEKSFEESLYDLPDFDDIDFSDTDTTEPFSTTSSTKNDKNQLDSAELAALDFDNFENKKEDPYTDPFATTFNQFYDDAEVEAAYSGEEANKKNKKAVIICSICAVICIFMTLLFLFVIPSKINISNKTNADETQETEKSEPIFLEPKPVTNAETIAIPAQENKVVVAPAEKVVPVKPQPKPLAKKEDITYTIRWGDTLWDIATAYYRNPWKYSKIANYNSIRNPDHIISGTTITIPAE